MPHQSTAVLLVNIGSPARPGYFPVARYLSEFLDNRRVISIPLLLRSFLVKGIIVPFRAWQSSKRYRVLWNNFGGKFPLSHYGEISRKLLQKELEEKAQVFLGMCYGKPPVEECITEIIKGKFTRLIILPLFPHYASSSTGVALEKIMIGLRKASFIPEIITVNSFYRNPLFARMFAEKISACNPFQYDKVLFTYHGLPLAHAQKADPDYEAVCLETSRLIAEKTGLPLEKYDTTFQSRMSARWISPFTEQWVIEKARGGVTSLLVAAPSFVADCLETSLELGDELKDLFFSNGGKKFTLIPSLNDHPHWIELLKDEVEKRMR